MDKKFLHKVLNQIVSETMVDYDKERLYTPFSPSPLSFSFYQTQRIYDLIKHCNEIYGLNIEEIEYVWEEYKEIIKDKIMNNG